MPLDGVSRFFFGPHLVHTPPPDTAAKRLFHDTSAARLLNQEVTLVAAADLATTVIPGILFNRSRYELYPADIVISF